KLLYEGVLKAKQRDLLIFLCCLSIGGDAKCRFAILLDLKVSARDSNAFRAFTPQSRLKISDEASHSFSAVVNFLVFIEAKTVQVLKKLPHDLPRLSGVFDGNLKLLACPHQSRVTNRVLVQSVVRKPL